MKFINWLMGLIAKLNSSLEKKPEAKLENVAPVKLVEKELPWMRFAKAELGQKEISGSKDNPRVIEYHSTTTLRAVEDEVPWCSSFVNWCFFKCGLTRTKSAAAKSWLNWGLPMDKPSYGCVVVKSRTGGNHVTFWMRAEKRDGVNGFIGLGGNQSNMVNEQWYPNSTVRGYRWPKDYT